VRRALALAVAVGSLVLAACGGGGSGSHRELIVSAASSLTDAFTRIGARFEQKTPGVAVRFNFGPSDGLAQQIEQGAPVDVFASASPSWMDAVAKDPGIRTRADFARNRLAVIMPADDPAGIERLRDLARPGVKLVLAAEGVPAGDYARQILKRAHIFLRAMANVVSNEEDVRGVLTKVLSGEADAGITYVTDVTPDIALSIRVIPIPAAYSVIATYPIGVVSGSAQPGLALRFVEFVLGPGERTLASYGFLPP
jgi:molybdate transport system substrate-binding protein